jgi:hypothetical protein
MTQLLGDINHVFTVLQLDGTEGVPECMERYVVELWAVLKRFAVFVGHRSLQGRLDNGILVSPLITPAAQAVASNVQQCLVGRTNGKITEIIRGYIEAVPDRWDLPLNILSYEALMKSCRAN